MSQQEINKVITKPIELQVAQILFLKYYKQILTATDCSYCTNMSETTFSFHNGKTNNGIYHSVL